MYIYQQIRYSNNLRLTFLFKRRLIRNDEIDSHAHSASERIGLLQSIESAFALVVQ